MSQIIKVKVPNIGDFKRVEVIEILVNEGDQIAVDDSLITVESDKASMEIPSPFAGRIQHLQVKLGDQIAEGTVLLTLEIPDETNNKTDKETGKVDHQNPNEGKIDIKAEVVVLGSGPGGYTAAFRAADLGKKVVLIERYPRIGGVCLNVGCIPSKALLHTADVINEAAEFTKQGVQFGQPSIDLDKLRTHKNTVIDRLTGGLKQLAKQRKVQIIQGYGRFSSAQSLVVEEDSGQQTQITFDDCIVAVGSSVTKLPFIPWHDSRVMDSTDALEIEGIPERLLVIGGGIIGLEMATVYDALGANVTIVELSAQLIPGADRDVVRPLERRIKKRYKKIYLKTKVTAVNPTDDGLVCEFEGKKAPASATFDRVLVAIGRQPNGNRINADKAGLHVDEQGFIPVDKQQRTNVDHIFAIGDVVGQPMLAHKATHEAKVAAEVIAGKKSFFDARAIPSVSYTDPEVAWMGKTENQLKEDGVAYNKGVFPWAASGRSLSIGRNDGMTKVLFDQDNGHLIGAAMVGPNAGELIAEAVLALEMGADAEDIALTIHPHPTLSETLNFASEVAIGVCTDLYLPKKK